MIFILLLWASFSVSSQLVSPSTYSNAVSPENNPDHAIVDDLAKLLVQTQQECGHSHQQENPWTKELNHQMTKDEPKWSVCQGPGGHPLHDCENGDPEHQWSPGACHPPCLPDDLISFLSEKASISAGEAHRLAQSYPEFIAFERANENGYSKGDKLIVRTCAGRTLTLAAI